MFDINITQCPYTDFSTILASVIGGLITGFFSWLATKQAHNHNRQLKNEELLLYEKATALSIVEELKAIKDLYERTFDEQFGKLQDGVYMNYLLTINPDCSTVYIQNAGELGLIKDKTLRSYIIKSNLLLKKFIEYLNRYNISSNQHDENRRNFMSLAYPNMVSKVSSQIDVNAFVDNFMARFFAEYQKVVEEAKMTEAQLVSFINNDKASSAYLCDLTKTLKTDYYNLKSNIELTINRANELYGE